MDVSADETRGVFGVEAEGGRARAVQSCAGESAGEAGEGERKVLGAEVKDEVP